jgi:type VI secretion system protein ImpC
LKDLESVFEGPQYIKWRNFRETEDSRYVGLAMPQFMLRGPYNEDTPCKEFNYTEVTNGENRNYLWGRASLAVANRMIESFAKYRWCPNIIGPQSGGSMDTLPTDLYIEDGKDTVVGPTEVALSDRREYELSEQGFIPLTMRKGADNATFFSANSAQKAKNFGNSDEGKQAELNYRLGTQLPYMMVICRIAHYIKVLQRENLGSWKGRLELEGELNKWIRQYVADQNNPTTDVRSRRPLRSADIAVLEVPGEAGWYQVKIEVTPHFKYMGANFTLSLTGKLETA